MFNYAQLDENDVVICVSFLSGEVISDRMIKLDSYDLSLLGQRYNRETGEFECPLK